MKATYHLILILILVGGAFSLQSCTGSTTELEARISELETKLAQLQDEYKPGLHTLMTQIMIRHARLWFAGDAQNWQLANHEIHELEEDLELIMELYAEYDGKPVAPLIQANLMPKVEAVEDAVKRQNKADFVKNFDAMTQLCNNCHVATAKPFIIIQRPTAPPFSNLKLK